MLLMLLCNQMQVLFVVSHSVLHCTVLQSGISKYEDCLTILRSMAHNARTSTLPRRRLYAVEGAAQSQTLQHNSINDCKFLAADDTSDTCHKTHQQLFMMSVLPPQGKVTSSQHANSTEMTDVQSGENTSTCQILNVSDDAFQDEQLIGDFSKPFCLPVVDSRHHDLKCISTSTVSV